MLLLGRGGWWVGGAWLWCVVLVVLVVVYDLLLGITRRLLLMVWDTCRWAILLLFLKYCINVPRAVAK
jgi:hypothetical protein